MPTSQNGFRTAIFGTVTGFAIYLLIQAIANQLGLGEITAFGLTVCSIILMMKTVEKMSYWSISYLIGWLLGTVVLGSYLSTPWETAFFAVVGTAFLIDKVRK